MADVQKNDKAPDNAVPVSAAVPPGAAQPSAGQLSAQRKDKVAKDDNEFDAELANKSHGELSDEDRAKANQQAATRPYVTTQNASDAEQPPAAPAGDGSEMPPLQGVN